MSKGKTINVLKPFTFTHAGSPQVRDPVTGKITAHAEAGYEKSFVVGDNQEMTDEMFDHPWIQAGADGAIESDDARGAREKAAKPAPAPGASSSSDNRK